MKNIEECRAEGPLAIPYLESTVANGRGLNAECTRRLVGMLVRGEGLTEPTIIIAPTPTAPVESDDDDSEGE